MRRRRYAALGTVRAWFSSAEFRIAWQWLRQARRSRAKAM